MSSRDTAADRSQPRMQIVVYEMSDTPQTELGSRLDATLSRTTVRIASDPVDLVASLTEPTPDCLVCHYGTEPPPSTDSLGAVLAERLALPRVAYVESPDLLTVARDRGCAAVHVRREHDDATVFGERIRAAIDAADTPPEPPGLAAAIVDPDGRVRRTAGDVPAPTPGDDPSPLWALPSTPAEESIAGAIDRLDADPDEPVVENVDGGRLVATPAGGAATGAPPDRVAVVWTSPSPTDATADGEPTPAIVDDVERYEGILETVSDGVYALDPAGRFTYVNRGLADLTGYSRSELLGSHVSVFKSDRTVARAERALREEIRRVREDSTAEAELSLDLDIETADGRTVPCTDHIALLPFDDQFRGSVGTLRDISDQQERERTLSGLLTVTRALMVAETTGEVAELVVEAVSNVLGYDRSIVHLFDEDAGELRPEAATEVVDSEVETIQTAVAGEGPIGSVFESGAAEVYDPAEAAGSAYRDAEALLCVPLGEYGVLTVGAEGGGFSESDRQLVQLLTANAEEALNRTQRRQTLRRYEMILESVQEMMCVVDSAGRIKLLTDPLARRLDADRSTIAERGLAAFLADTGADLDDGPLADLFDRTASDVSFTDSLLVGDEAVPVSVEASTLPHIEGRPEAVVTIHDISDLVSAKEAAAAERERFTYLFENLTDPVDEIRLEDDGATVEGVNSAFRSLFGDGGDDAAAEAAPIALDDDRVVESGIPQSADGLRSEGEWELKLTTTEGTKYFLYRSVSYDLGDAPGGFEIYTDITALKQREIQLQVLHRLLRHNLRNDLNVIEGFAELLMSELDDERHRQFADRIRSNATQLAELSETANTIESVVGHRELDRRPVELDELVDGTIAACATTYEAADVSTDELASVTVAAGPPLETAITELVDNAVEHNHRETPAVSVAVAADADTATITISDNGPGIPPAEWAVVTGDTEISQLEHGSGLGLWLVRWVTEAYGGELTYHEREPGSTVTIRLPIVGSDDS
ncbi:PAS domain S-box protein [Halohasta salina]|uniref:PAS domain S-box protein n=1 Tax=Halohasta salina TaxID=2961621 RepID=UPI0020A345F2|nr:PAS domain S-box protein [Halohasta salina]